MGEESTCRRPAVIGPIPAGPAGYDGAVPAAITYRDGPGIVSALRCIRAQRDSGSILPRLASATRLRLRPAHASSGATPVSATEASPSSAWPQAQIQYLSQFGKFASTLIELGPPASGAAGPTAANIIPASLASGEKDGYVLTIIPTTAGFAVNANPKVFGNTGRRTFYSDENGVVHQNWGRDPATASSPEIRQQNGPPPRLAPYCRRTAHDR